MERLLRLLPFALSGALIVGATLAIVVVTIKDIPLGERSTALAVRSSVPGRPGAELSRTGRLSWWRAEPEKGAQLWVANADGTLRRAIAQADDLRRVSRTRWLPAGDAVAYLDGGAKLVVARLDGGRSEIRLADALLADSRRIVDQRWSKSGTKVAATVQRTADGRSDVWTAKLGGDSWVRATQLDDAIAGEWIDDDELLFNTTGGIVGILREGTLNRIRPITGLQGGTPILGEDGRVLFLAGRVSPGSTDVEPMTLVTDATLWSANLDGSDPRAEQRLGAADGLRLDGRWPDGRILVHRGAAAGQALIGNGEIAGLSNAAGLIERVAVASDKKSALAFSSTRVVRLDLSKPQIASTVLLDGIADPDAWSPASGRTVRPAEAALPGKRPAANYVYALGGSLWSMDIAGVSTLLRPGPANLNPLRRVPVPLPAWSPKGDLLLTNEFAPGPQTQTTLGSVTIDRGGAVTRLAPLASVLRIAPVWSPDGRTVAAISAPPGAQVQNPPDDLAVRFATLDGSATPPAVPGREVAWSKSGLYVLSNGTLEPTLRFRTGQAIEIVSGAVRRPLVAIDALLADPRALVPPEGVTSRGAAQLAASPDGAYVSVGLSWVTQPQSRFIIALVRTADGRATFVPADLSGDLAWSPTKPVLGYTVLENRQQGSATVRVQVATVIDAASGETTAKHDGRFAGWSPDGEGYYIARDSGLTWQAIGTSESIRIGPVGVPVAATRP